MTMTREEATKEKPLLNNIDHYIPDKTRKDGKWK